MIRHIQLLQHGSSLPWAIAFTVLTVSASYVLLDMWHTKILSVSTITASLLATVHGQISSCPAPASANTAWYSPNQTQINSLGSVLNGTGVYGFVFNGSMTPSSEPYSTYNWCNAPHTRAQEYVRPNSSFKLEYVEVVSLALLRCLSRVQAKPSLLDSSTS